MQGIHTVLPGSPGISNASASASASGYQLCGAGDRLWHPERIRLAPGAVLSPPIPHPRTRATGTSHPIRLQRPGLPSYMRWPQYETVRRLQLRARPLQVGGEIRGELIEIALVGAHRVHRGVAVQPQVGEEGSEQIFHCSRQYAADSRPCVTHDRGASRRCPHRRRTGAAGWSAM